MFGFLDLPEIISIHGFILSNRTCREAHPETTIEQNPLTVFRSRSAQDNLGSEQ